MTDVDQKFFNSTEPNKQINETYTLIVNIIDATTAVTKINFKIQTKTNNKNFKQKISTVTRCHDDFKWLHNVIMSSSLYAGYLIPLPPLEPDFSNSRDKFNRYSQVQHQVQKQYGNDLNDKSSGNKTLDKLKQDCEAEYLASFKKCVTSHENFLQRLGEHELFSKDYNLKMFLTENETNLLSYQNSTKSNQTGRLGQIFKYVKQFSDESIFKTTPIKDQRFNWGMFNQKDLESFYKKLETEMGFNDKSHNESTESASNLNVSNSSGVSSASSGSLYGKNDKIDFDKKYVYSDDKLMWLSYCKNCCEKILIKQKSLSNYSDWLNEILGQVYTDQKLTEIQTKTSKAMIITPSPQSSTPKNSETVKSKLTNLQKSSQNISQLVNDPLNYKYLSETKSYSMLPEILILHKSMLLEARAESKLANDFDLNLKLNFETLVNDYHAVKDLLYRRVKTREKYQSIQKQVHTSSNISQQSYESQLLIQKQEMLKSEVLKYDSIGGSELNKLDLGHLEKIPKILAMHGKLQHNTHKQTGLAIKSLLDKI